jgi:hypothetical protein
MNSSNRFVFNNLRVSLVFTLARPQLRSIPWLARFERLVTAWHRDQHLRHSPIHRRSRNEHTASLLPGIALAVKGRGDLYVIDAAD